MLGVRQCMVHLKNRQTHPEWRRPTLLRNGKETIKVEKWNSSRFLYTPSEFRSSCNNWIVSQQVCEGSMQGFGLGVDQGD